MLHNCSEMHHMQKNLYGGYTALHILQKNICGAFAWNAILMGFICHAMSLHPEYITSIASVNNYIINHICVKQWQQDNWTECKMFSSELGFKFLWKQKIFCVAIKLSLVIQHGFLRTTESVYIHNFLMLFGKMFSPITCGWKFRLIFLPIVADVQSPIFLVEFLWVVDVIPLSCMLCWFLFLCSGRCCFLVVLADVMTNVCQMIDGWCFCL